MKQLSLFLIFLILFLIRIDGYSQDYIYFKDKTLEKVQVLEVGIEKIKYKKCDIPKSPIFEVLKSDVIKIQYNGGHIDQINKEVIIDSLTSSQTTGPDSTRYAEIYIVFNSGQDESAILPLYINGKFLYTIRNHMRITYRVYSSGMMIIERILKKKTGPTTEFLVELGNKYGLRISEPYPQALDPDKKFTFKLYETPAEFDKIFIEEFNGFKPFKSEDIHLREEIKFPAKK